MAGTKQIRLGRVKALLNEMELLRNVSLQLGGEAFPGLQIAVEKLKAKFPELEQEKEQVTSE